MLCLFLKANKSVRRLKQTLKYELYPLKLLLVSLIPQLICSLSPFLPLSLYGGVINIKQVLR